MLRIVGVWSYYRSSTKASQPSTLSQCFFIIKLRDLSEYLMLFILPYVISYANLIYEVQTPTDDTLFRPSVNSVIAFHSSRPVYVT